MKYNTLLVRGLIVIFGLFTLASCNHEPEAGKDADNLYVVTTTGMIEDAVINIAGDLVQVTALMGPGVDPHLYKATQGDIAKLTDADLILYNGLLLEGKMGEVLEKLKRTKPVVAVAEVINPEQLLKSPIYKTAYDPHVWFDVSIWVEAVGAVGQALKDLDPDNSAVYQSNQEKYLARLDSLHQATINRIASIPNEQRVLITAHDAFEYFGRVYHMEVRGLQGISTLSEFGLRDRVDLVNFIIEKNIKAVFVETSVSKKSIEAVVEGCQKKGHQVTIGGQLYSDAMGAKGTPDGTYIGMVNANVQTITNALK